MSFNPNKQTNLGSLQGQASGRSLSNLNGYVSYTTPSVNLGNNWSANAHVSRQGNLNSFSTNTGVNQVGVGFTFKF